MKAKLKTEQEAFKPVTIEITLETETEYASFRGLINYVPIYDMAENVGIDLGIIKDAIPEPANNNETWADFVERLKGNQ